MGWGRRVRILQVVGSTRPRARNKRRDAGNPVCGFNIVYLTQYPRRAGVTQSGVITTGATEAGDKDDDGGGSAVALCRGRNGRELATRAVPAVVIVFPCSVGRQLPGLPRLGLAS
jgi:hypothetical protein